MTKINCSIDDTMASHLLKFCTMNIKFNTANEIHTKQTHNNLLQNKAHLGNFHNHDNIYDNIHCHISIELDSLRGEKFQLQQS